MLIAPKSNSTDTGRHDKIVSSSTTGKIKNPFEEKINELMDDILDVHRVGVSMSFLKPDDELGTLIRAIESHVHNANP